MKANEMTITVEKLATELKTMEDSYKNGRISKEQLMNTWAAYRNLFGTEFVSHAIGLMEIAKRDNQK